MKSFQIIPVIRSGNFLIIWYKLESPQVKQNSISSITNLVHALPHELLNNLRLRILANLKILKNVKFSRRHTHFFFFAEIKI